MSEPMSPEDYAEQGGLECPICGSGRLITPLPPKVYGAQLRQLVRCDECTASWDDVYSLTSYITLTKGD
jgi:DNA-directed RNA polymerase subunit RPC12/RpoP